MQPKKSNEENYKGFGTPLAYNKYVFICHFVYLTEYGCFKYNVKEKVTISMNMNFENVLYEVKDGILYLTLNRPEVRNALSPEMWRDITAAVQAARVDDEIRVVIVTHTGDKALASGADIQELHDRYYMKQMLGTATEALQALENLNKPTICAINGFAFGGGCELALSCDIRVATSRSKFGQPEVNLSLIPGAGGTQRLPRLVGPGIAKEMIYTGMAVSAERALEIGLVNHVTEDTHEAVIAEAERIARKIMEKGPVAIQMAKLAINMGCNVDMNTGLMIERLAQTIALSTEDRKEGTAAFLEKRPAQFKGR